MAKRDYYEVLGVPKNAEEREIKKAYKRLAMKFHPDRNQGDKESEGKFKEIKEAYEILSDSQKRAAYDQFGHAGVDASAGGGRPGNGQGGFGDIFEDIFGDIFGGGTSTTAKSRTPLSNPPTSPLNLIGKLEGWGIGPATPVAEVSIKVSAGQNTQITGAQLKELLKKLPDGMTFELSLEKEDN